MKPQPHRSDVYLPVKRALWLCFVLFVTNDFLYVAVQKTTLIYIVDYAFRLAVLLVIFLILQPRVRDARELGEAVYLLSFA